MQRLVEPAAVSFAGLVAVAEAPDQRLDQRGALIGRERKRFHQDLLCVRGHNLSLRGRAGL